MPPTPNQWLKTLPYRIESRKGKVVVVIMNSKTSEVVGTSESKNKSHVVRVQLGGDLVIVYATTGLWESGQQDFSKLTSRDTYYIFVFDQGEGKAYGPLYSNPVKQKLLREKTSGKVTVIDNISGPFIGYIEKSKEKQVDFKTGGENVLYFTKISANQLLKGAKDIKSFHKL